MPRPRPPWPRPPKPVLIADGGGISNNPRFRSGQRVALEVHPLAYEIPPISDAELETFAEDARKHGIVTPLLLIPDHNDPMRKQTAKPGEQPLVLDKDGKPIPKLKVGDGRHRLFVASQFDQPVRLELFDGTEEEARERIVSLNVRRRMLHPRRSPRSCARSCSRLRKPRPRNDAEKVIARAEKVASHGGIPPRLPMLRRRTEGPKSRSSKLSGTPSASTPCAALPHSMTRPRQRRRRSAANTSRTLRCVATRSKKRRASKASPNLRTCRRKARPAATATPTRCTNCATHAANSIPNSKGTQTSKDRVDRLQQIIREAMELLTLERKTQGRR